MGMDEYLVNAVDQEEHVIRLKSYGNNIAEVVDNLVKMPGLESVASITRQSDSRVWNQLDKDTFKTLKEMRGVIDKRGLEGHLKLALQDL